MSKKIKILVKNAKLLNILVIEDEVNTKLEIKEVLSIFFNRVDLASNGEQGLESYIKYQNKNSVYYDIVVTDVYMPKMDGIELSKEILKINPNQVIIVFSANDRFSKMVDLINAGVNYFIQKPFSKKIMTKVLLKAVKEVVNDLLIEKYHKKVETINSKLEQKTKQLNDLNSNLELKVNEQTASLKKRLYYDILTELPKRNKLMEDMKEYKNIGMLLINVNRFKNINNAYGYKIGDTVLKKFANILKTIAKDNNCMLYSLSGDEFVFVSLEAKVAKKCIETAKNLVSSIEKTGINIQIDGDNVNIFLSVTVGISHGDDEPLLAADMALKYAVKKRVPYILYTKELHIKKDVSDYIKWTKTIVDAIKEDGVQPFYQPIIYDNNKIKYECLIRIVENEKVISPFLFLDIAKKIRYYTSLTKIMIEKSFKEFEKRDNEFSINFSFEDILDKEVVNFLLKKLNEYKVNKRLIIEILESENIDDFEILKDFVKKMKILGVRIAIDDFGSGYSNFSYILQMKPDFIKIDGSIIKNIDHCQNSYNIAKSITQFAKRINAKTIAEYIHSKDVYDKAKKLKIDAFQGFYFSEPKKNVIDINLKKDK